MLNHSTAAGIHTETQRRFTAERERDSLRRAAQETRAVDNGFKGLMAAVKAKLSTRNTAGTLPRPAV